MGCLHRMLRDEDEKGVIRLGSLIVYDIGQLLPHQMQTGHYNTTYCVYPVSILLLHTRLLILSAMRKLLKEVVLNVLNLAFSL
jgi:hypothetical protein